MSKILIYDVDRGLERESISGLMVDQKPTFNLSRKEAEEAIKHLLRHARPGIGYGTFRDRRYISSRVTALPLCSAQYVE